MPVGWAALAGGVFGAAGSITAANTQANAQNNAAGIQQGMFNTINNQEQPFIQAGYGATSQLASGLAPGGQFNSSFTPADYLANQDPGYQFQLQTGGQAIRNADTPTQGALSGSALKDLITFNQGTAATGYQNAFNRYQTNTNNIFNRLSSIAGLGQSAATQVGNSGTQLGTGIAQATAGAGASTAGGIVGATNSLASGGNTAALYSILNNNNPNAGGVGSIPTAANGGTLTYDEDGNITGSLPSTYQGGGQ
jgi:hypothetical protein